MALELTQIEHKIDNHPDGTWPAAIVDCRRFARRAHKSRRHFLARTITPQVRQLGFSEATILSNSVDSVAAHLAEAL